MLTRIKNKLYFVFIILSAIFTIIAYVSDQVVLRKENTDRVMNSNYQNLDLEINKISNYKQTVAGFYDYSTELFLFNLKKNNFILKNLILTSSKYLEDEDKKKNIESLTDDYKNFGNLSKSQQIYSLNRFISSVEEISLGYFKLFALESKNELFIKLKNFKFELNDKLIDLSKLFEENEKKFFYYRSFDDLNATLALKDGHTVAEDYSDNNLNKIIDLRNFKLLLLETLFNEAKYLYELDDTLEEVVDAKILERDSLLEKIKDNKYIINLFILIGISSQILTLLFLLLFFKSLLKQGLRI